MPLRNEETASIIQNSRFLDSATCPISSSVALTSLLLPEYCRIPEDLAIALDTALDVNRHLNSQVEGLIREVDSLKGERDAAVEHARHLSKKLSQARREGDVQGEGVGVYSSIQSGEGFWLTGMCNRFQERQTGGSKVLAQGGRCCPPIPWMTITRRIRMTAKRSTAGARCW